jgi:hypothetical protein
MHPSHSPRPPRALPERPFLAQAIEYERIKRQEIEAALLG